MLITSHQSKGLWGLAIYALFEGQGRVIWGYNLLFRLNFDFMLGILILRSIISNKKLINREVLPNYLIVGIFLFFVWFVLEMFNPNGAGIFPSFATAKIYIFPFLLFFLFQNFPVDPRDKETQKRFFLFSIFIFLSGLVVIVQAQNSEEFLYGISPYYQNLFASYSKFKGMTFRPWGMSFVPGGMSVLFYLAVPFLLLLRPDVVGEGRKFKSGLVSLFKIVTFSIVMYSSFICQVRSATLKLVLIILGFSFFKFIGSRMKFKRAVTVIAVVLALAGGASFFDNIIDLDTDSVTRALDRYEGLAESGFLANRLDFDTFMKVFDERVELPFGYGLGMTQNFLPDFQARRVKYVDKPAVAFWSNDNLIVFLLIELGLGAFIYLFIIFAVNLSLYSRFITLLRWRQVTGFTVIAACCVTCFVLTIFNWGAVALPFNPESFFFWFWAAMGFNTFKAVKFEKMT
jgi:hypothetical protein